MTGSILKWNAFQGSGLITGDPPQNGTFFFQTQGCVPATQTALSTTAVPPAQIQVSFDVAVNREAINVTII